MPATAIKKVTVSLPMDLLDFADASAAKHGATRSALIGELLRERRDCDREALASEGYRYYGREAVEFASSTHRAAAAAVSEDDTAW